MVLTLFEGLQVLEQRDLQPLLPLHFQCRDRVPMLRWPSHLGVDF